MDEWWLNEKISGCSLSCVLWCLPFFQTHSLMWKMFYWKVDQLCYLAGLCLRVAQITITTNHLDVNFNWRRRDCRTWESFGNVWILFPNPIIHSHSRPKYRTLIPSYFLASIFTFFSGKARLVFPSYMSHLSLLSRKIWNIDCFFLYSMFHPFQYLVLCKKYECITNHKPWEPIG